MPKLVTTKLRTMVEPGVYGDGGGLYLQVRDSEHRSWIYRFTLFGKARWMGLGSFDDVSLAEAREAAAAARKLVKQCFDPIEERKAELAKRRAAAEVFTFDQVAELYIGAHEGSWKNAKHRDQWRTTLATYAKPILGKLSIATVDVGAVMRVLEPIWTEKPETASRLRGRIESVLDYATARGWRIGENPARWRGHIETMLPARAKVAKVEHHAALPWQKMPEFWPELVKQEGASALALRFAILTATRTNETLGACWPEFDRTSKTWLIPAARMKAGREHRVALSDEALTVLDEAWKLRAKDAADDAHVFPGRKTGKPLSNMALLMTLRRMGRDDLTAHGFRSSFRDWCGEATAYPSEVAEIALAHINKDRTEAAYARGDLIEKRRKMMADWGAYCTRPRPAANVVQLHAANA